MQFCDIEIKFIPLFNSCRFSARDLTLICTASCGIFSYTVCCSCGALEVSWSRGPFLFKEYFSSASTSCSLLNLTRCETINCIFSKSLHTCPYACFLQNIIMINIISGLTKMRLTIFLPAVDRERGGRVTKQRWSTGKCFWCFVFAFSNLHTSYNPSSHILFPYLCRTFTEFNHLLLKQLLSLCTRFTGIFTPEMENTWSSVFLYRSWDFLW